MSTTGPTVRTQPDKNNGRRPDVVVVPKQGGEFAGVSDLVGGSLIAAGAGTVEAQAARLGDARLAGIQRRAAAAQIGAKQGNQHLQRVVASVTQGASSVGGQLSPHSKHSPSNGPRAVGRGVVQPTAIDEPGALELDSAPALAPGYGPSQPLGQNGSSDSTWVQRQKARSVQAVLDPELPSGPAAMVRSLPTPAPAQEEEKSDYFGSISGLRQAASSRIAVAVRDIPGYHLLTLVVGRDPVTDEAIERTPTDVLRTALSIIPGGDAIFQNLDESGAVDRAFAWLSNQLIKLNLTWETIKGLFRRAWEALDIKDLLDPLGAWEKLRGVFLAPVIRLRSFVVSVGHKMLEFVFEGVMAKLDGGPVLALLQRAGGAFMQIVHNPIGFLSNLIGGVKQGLLNFVARIGDHLKTGLLSWLFGELAATGVEMPAEFNMRGLMALVMQVLGLTWQSIRTRAGKAFGERVAGVLERSFELFTIIREQGPGGLWEHVQKELGDLKETVLGGIQEMLVTQVIQAGVQWIVSLLGGPAGAVVKAITMIRDLVMWFVNTGSRVFALVNAIADSLGAIASGSIGVAAKAVEDTLGRMVPVAISFLASLLGLGDLGKKVLGIIQKVRGRIDKTIDMVLVKAKSVAKKLMATMRGGEKEKLVGSETKFTEKDRTAALAAIDTTEKAHAQEGVISYKEATKAAAIVKAKHPVFKSLEVVDGNDSWDYQYVFRATHDTKAAKKAERDDLNKARAKFKDRLFAKVELEQLGLKTPATQNIRDWLDQGMLFGLKPRPRDPFTKHTLYTFSAERADPRFYSGRRKPYGYNNSRISWRAAMEVLNKGLDKQPADPAKLFDLDWHRKHGRYNCKRSGKKNLRFSQVILGHHEDYGASDHWNDKGHRQTAKQNQAWNTNPANYQGPEEMRESSRSAARSPLYRIPAAIYKSNDVWL